MEAQERSKRLLAALVREYIASGEPVASSVLVTAAGLGISSATVRNILARLEEDGFVQQPHTSAGRIPDRSRLPLLRRPAARGQAIESNAPQPSRHGCAATRQGRSPMGCCRRCRTCCRRLSWCRLRDPASAHEAAVFDRVEFVPLSASRVLVVIVARGGHVLQKVVETSEALTADELRAGGQLPERGILRPAAAPRARGGARADAGRADAVRRADGARDAARHLDVRGSAGRADDLRRRRGGAARGRAASSRSARCRRSCR